jgi:16S rRNA (cytidine1402-2'-O)-methyltransferase
LANLYLIPTPISDESIHTLPEYVLVQIRALDHFVAEKAKTARHFIKNCNHPKSMSEIEVKELDKHAANQDWSYLLEALLTGHDIGFVSEAGCPGVADPGAKAVSWARKNGFKIVPMVGPSSILLALMASGMNGQNFCFQGYLPNKPNELKNKLRQMENLIARIGQTQIFIETPYRNEALLKTILNQISSHIVFCVAKDITGKEEVIISKSVADWKKSKLPSLHKTPCIFLLGS